MAITCYNDIINNRANGKYADVYFYKPLMAAAPVANAWYSFLRMTGTAPNIGFPADMQPTAIGSNGAICTSQTRGAIALPDRTGSDAPHLLTFGMGLTGAISFSAFMLVDVLWAGSGVDMNSSSTQNINSQALTRYTGGEGNYIMMVPTTAYGATGATIQFVYTDDTSTSRTVTSSTILASGPLHRCVNVPPAPVSAANAIEMPFLPYHWASKGVKSIQSVKLSAGTGSGACDIYIVHPITIVTPIATAQYVEKPAELQINGITKLECDSNGHPGCYGILGFGSTTTANQVFGFIRTVYG